MKHGVEHLGHRLLPRHLLGSILAFTLIILVGCGPRPPDSSTPRHTVLSGDTIGSVATAYGVDIATIIEANSLRRRNLSPGQVLMIPGGRAKPDLPPEIPEAKVEPSGQMRFKPRSTWTLQPIDVGNTDPMKPITCITIHHSGRVDDLVYEPREALRKFERYHRNNKGMAAIGYHFIIDGNGTIWEGRPLTYQGAHARGDNNIGNIGICLMGYYEDSAPNKAMLLALDYAMKKLAAHYRIPRNRLFGHRDFVPSTECPGAHMQRLLVRYQQTGRF